MLAFLPSTEEIIRVDGRMSESIRGLEEVPVVPATSQPVRARRKAVPLHCGLASNSQRGLGTGRRTLPTTRLFYEQGVSKSRRKVSPDGEIGPYPHDCYAETQTIFPSSCHHSPDGPTIEESDEQP